jgi:hypothetical protein
MRRVSLDTVHTEVDASCPHGEVITTTTTTTYGDHKSVGAPSEGMREVVDDKPVVDGDVAKAVLAAIYKTNDGANWGGLNEGWMTDSPLGEWGGVITDEDGHVQQINLSFNTRIKLLPDSIAELKTLAALQLSGCTTLQREFESSDENMNACYIH